MTTVKTENKKTSGRWNEEVTAKAVELYQAATKPVDGETNDQAIARANHVDSLNAIVAEINAMGEEVYTAAAVRMKLSSEKVYIKLDVKPAVGGAKSLRKAHIIKALQDACDSPEKAELYVSLEKANLDTLITLVKDFCGDEIIAAICEAAGVDKL